MARVAEVEMNSKAVIVAKEPTMVLVDELRPGDLIGSMHRPSMMVIAVSHTSLDGFIDLALVSNDARLAYVHHLSDGVVCLWCQGR